MLISFNQNESEGRKEEIINSVVDKVREENIIEEKETMENNDNIKPIVAKIPKIEEEKKMEELEFIEIMSFDVEVEPKKVKEDETVQVEPKKVKEDVQVQVESKKVDEDKQVKVESNKVEEDKQVKVESKIVKEVEKSKKSLRKSKKSKKKRVKVKDNEMKEEVSEVEQDKKSDTIESDVNETVRDNQREKISVKTKSEMKSEKSTEMLGKGSNQIPDNPCLVSNREYVDSDPDQVVTKALPSPARLKVLLGAISVTLRCSISGFSDAIGMWRLSRSRIRSQWISSDTTINCCFSAIPASCCNASSRYIAPPGLCGLQNISRRSGCNGC